MKENKMLAKFSDFEEPLDEDLYNAMCQDMTINKIGERQSSYINIFEKEYEYRNINFKITILDRYVVRGEIPAHADYQVSVKISPIQKIYSDLYSLYEGDRFLNKGITTTDLPVGFYDIVQFTKNQIDNLLDIIIGRAVSEIERSRK